MYQCVRCKRLYSSLEVELRNFDDCVCGGGLVEYDDDDDDE
jgi:hypothetical protein